MDNWARELAERKNKELEAKLKQDEKDLSDRKMLDSHIGPAWDEVRRHIDEVIKDYNQYAKREVSITYHASSSNDRLVLQIGTDTHVILLIPSSWAIMGTGSRYTLSVVAGNGVMWKDDNGSLFTAHLIAQNQIEAAVNKKNY
jgi:acyl-CoA reductase-like NAD-dependent aldehyde dehydrogenase